MGSIEGLNLSIKDEFSSLYAPLNDRYINYRDRLIEEYGTSFESVFFWKEEMVILDGHETYQLWLDGKISAPTAVPVSLESHDDALAWIYSRILDTCDSRPVKNTDHIRPYSEWELEEAKDEGVIEIARKAGCNPAEVARLGEYAKAIDRITEIEPGFRKSLLSFCDVLDVIDIGKLSDNEIRVACDNLKRFDHWSKGLSNEE